MRNEIIKLPRPVYITSAASVVGKYEHEGPFGDIFDEFDTTDRFDCDSWEKAEGEMQKRAQTEHICDPSYVKHRTRALCFLLYAIYCL